MLTAIIVGSGVAAVLLWLASRYKRCPSNKVLVVYARNGSECPSVRCLNGGGAMVWPVKQRHKWLNMEPMRIEACWPDTTSTFDVGISTDVDALQFAAEDLLRQHAQKYMNRQRVSDLAFMIIRWQRRVAINRMRLDDLWAWDADREQAVANIKDTIDSGLRGYGMYLIDADIKDIEDYDGHAELVHWNDGRPRYLWTEPQYHLHGEHHRSDG